VSYFFSIVSGKQPLLMFRTSNPGGIRFGSAEIYDVIDACFSAGSPALTASRPIVDCLAVGQVTDGGVDERVILFVKLEEGESLSFDLENKVKAEIRAQRSPRHVPSRVSPACPTCLLGKTRCSRLAGADNPSR
jgi:acyl-coenzyme A synthetase/AMP-(fatty) acid ligase